MQIRNKSIRKFMEIYEEETGLRLDRKTAEEYAYALLKLTHTIYN